jgi:hypothetical protein
MVLKGSKAYKDPRVSRVYNPLKPLLATIGLYLIEPSKGLIAM